MGNWTDRFDPETVDEIKRYEVVEGDFLLAERLAMHKGVESVFGFHVNCLGLGKPYWEKGVYLGDVLDFFDRHGETLIEKRAGSWHGDSTEVAKASECLQKGLAQFGLTLAQASAVNGIYPEDVADLPTIETAIPRLREIFAGADEVIGYNVGFDLGFLSAVGVRPRADARITDTMKEFTWFMGRRYKLVDAADHIGYEWTGRAHGSLADALATLAVQRWLEQWLVAE